MKVNTDLVQIGTVVDNTDPNYIGRCKIRVKGLNDNIPVEQLPWVTYGGGNVFSGSAGGQLSVPRVGAQVRVKFKKDDVNSMEWYAINSLDKKLSEEIASDYKGSHVLLYDSESDLSIKFQPNSGLVLYYKGSFIQITPDNNITVHYGSQTSGTEIQLSNGQINIVSSGAVNINSAESVKVEADNIVINGKDSVQIKGDSPGECAVNGKALMSLLATLAQTIDLKVPQSGGIATMMVSGAKESILNQNISYM